MNNYGHEEVWLMENLAHFSIRSMLNCTQKQYTLAVAGEFGECVIKDINTFFRVFFSSRFFVGALQCIEEVSDKTVKNLRRKISLVEHKIT